MTIQNLIQHIFVTHKMWPKISQKNGMIILVSFDTDLVLGFDHMKGNVIKIEEKSP